MNALGSGARQLLINSSRWRTGDFIKDYGGRALTPAEVILIARYREPLSGRTLELGCGAGRVLGYLAQLSNEAHGADISPRMVEHCRLAYPRAEVRLGDVADPRSCGDGRFDAIWATNNLLDILDDANRRRVLRELAGMIESNGILIFSSHNLDAPPAGPRPLRAVLGGPWNRGRARELVRRAAFTRPADAVRGLARAPAEWRNRRALAPLCFEAEDYAVLNDEAHAYSLLHYYIRRDDQERQLAQLGYGLLECLDTWGNAVGPGEVSPSHELHYVAYPK